MKKLLQIVFVLSFFCLSGTSVAQAKSNDFTITGYQVDMKVTKQNIYRITEKIAVNFSEDRHGLYRDIPLLNKIQRQDGSTGSVMAKIDHISCSDDYSASRESSGSGDFCRLKIGDEDETVIGQKNYTISYDYIMGNDVLKDNDELYFNVIGTKWQTTIRNVTFSIEMPDAFDSDQLGMSYGSYGESRLKGLSYRIEGNTIQGKLDPAVVLQPGEGVNVRLLLPEGYFEHVDETPTLAYCSIIVAVLGAILAFVLWYIFGRDDPVIETVEFYPPDGLNSLELAFAYKGSTDSDDVVSLLVYLAQKGYLKIYEEGRKDFIIEKVKDYDGLNEAERTFFNGLFTKGDRVRKADLQNSFYTTVNLTKSMVDNKKNKEVIYQAGSINKGWILWTFTILSFILDLFIPAGEYEFSMFAGIILGLGAALVTCFCVRSLFSQRIRLGARVTVSLGLLVVDAAVYLLFIRDALRYVSEWYILALLVCYVCGAVTMFFCAFLYKRTPYGTEILGKIRGFRNFLDVAEKERLEALVQDDPQYFYEILPYTYVLDLSNKWMDKFESIAIEPPYWYSGTDTDMFDMVMFHQFMNTTMVQAASSMVSMPSSSGGGGFSGGGSGGGGGGSW